MEEAFRKIVEHIFNNWTALKLAVEHSMGGPDSKQVALDSMDYVVKYLTEEPNIEIEDIEDVLEDIMDQEFNTICEDNSIKEISRLLLRFLQLLKDGNSQQCEVEYNALPISNNWLLQRQADKIQQELNQLDDENMAVEPESSTPAASQAKPQSEQSPPKADTEKSDSEWVEVKSRKKR